MTAACGRRSGAKRPFLAAEDRYSHGDFAQQGSGFRKALCLEIEPGMKMRKDFEDLDLVSAMWIIASNDGNHMITYKGMYERLGLKDDKEVRVLVNKHRELFRPDSALHDLERWKNNMCDGKNRPFWIRNMANEDDRLQAINSLKTSDAFRSQFRVGSNSPRSAVEIISWGLDHIDRLRKSRMASREANAKSWQIWLVFSIGILNIVATVVGFLMKSSASF